MNKLLRLSHQDLQRELRYTSHLIKETRRIIVFLEGTIESHPGAALFPEFWDLLTTSIESERCDLCHYWAVVKLEQHRRKTLVGVL